MYLFIFLFLSALVFIAAQGLSLVAARGTYFFGAQALSVWAQELWCLGLVVLKHRLSFPDQGVNPCPLDWKVDS